MLDPYFDDRLPPSLVDAARSLQSRSLGISLPEVAFVWSRKRTFGTYLFALNRYLPFVDLTLSLLALVIFLSPEGCYRQYSAIAWLNTAGVTISQVILYLRTIAIWERNRWVAIILGTTFVTMLATAVVATKLMLKSLQFKPSDPDFFFGCDLVHTDLYILVSFGAIFISETSAFEPQNPALSHTPILTTFSAQPS
ncbi:hypothetical protein CVT26_006834 [Gymnopilus dilepis]|uniref:DUF6533 domain-containing protein n=1 Tax=Gymnopilus dilepis TaxID=231916 RepID=A0A409VMZ7_9AGAR|nr:hypothetical protein CVT26_006834 [Gymnopilus dilepis]